MADVTFPDTVRPERWAVERGGTGPGHYLPGWFAECIDRPGTAAWLPTHAEAVAFADARARESGRAQAWDSALGRWGVELEPPREPPAPGISRAGEILTRWLRGENTREIRSAVGGSLRHVQAVIRRYRLSGLDLR